MNKSDVKCFRFLCKPIHNDFFSLISIRHSHVEGCDGCGKFRSWKVLELHFEQFLFHIKLKLKKKQRLFKKGIDRFSLIAMALMPRSAIKQNTSKQM